MPAGHALAQSSILQRVNEIKQDELYYWQECSHLIADTAFQRATGYLLLEANQDMAQTLSQQQIAPYVQHIKIMRGEKTRMFVYMLKSDARGIAAGQAPPPPVTAEWVAAQPAATTYAPATPPNSTPPAGGPQGVSHRREAEGRPQRYVPDEFVLNILDYKGFRAVYNYLEGMKRRHRVLQFGALRDIEEYASLDIILFDRQSQQVVTILSGQRPDGMRTNLVTGADDSLDNYPEEMALAIWYIRK